MNDQHQKLIDLLVVDDDELVLEKYRRYFLRNTNFSYVLTEQPSEARTIISNGGARFVVVDFRMPEILGTDLLTELIAVDSPVNAQFILCSASYLSPD